MPTKFDKRFSIDLPPSLKAERRGNIAILTLTRPEKKNAMNAVLMKV